MADITADSKRKVATNSACFWFIPWRLTRETEKTNTMQDVPGAEASGLVAPSITRPVLTASRPCQTMATTGPEAMYLIRPGKNGLSFRSS